MHNNTAIFIVTYHAYKRKSFSEILNFRHIAIFLMKNHAAARLIGAVLKNIAQIFILPAQNESFAVCFT